MPRDPALTPDATFDMLRTASPRENIELREVALRIVGHRAPADDDEGGRTR